MESINPHISREYEFGLKVTDRYGIAVSRKSIFLQDYKHITLLGFIEERNITYVDRRDQFELIKYLQMFEYSGVGTKCPYIHQSYR